MSQSLSRIYLHVIFSTKYREPVLRDDFRAGLHESISEALRMSRSTAVEINSESDHLHVLLVLPRTQSIASVVRVLKRTSSVWVRNLEPSLSDFHWQNGYGAFSISQSRVGKVREYIRNQREHHCVQTFRDEFVGWLERYRIEFDERYVWD